MPKNDAERRNWWPIGVGIALFVVVVINAVFIYVAVAGRDPVVPSYKTEAR